MKRIALAFLAAGLLLTLCAMPFVGVAAADEDENLRFFPETGHYVGGDFLRFWQANGGLEVFGFPKSEEMAFPPDGAIQQFFERAVFTRRLSLNSSYGMVLEPLGTLALGARSPERLRPFESSATRLYFAEAGHSLSFGFLDFWQRHGGMDIFGYPLTEEFQEISPTDGQAYTVQYFERARFEYHPELPPPYRVSLGLLGDERIRQLGLPEDIFAAVPEGLENIDPGLRRAVARLNESDDLRPFLRDVVENAIPVQFSARVPNDTAAYLSILFDPVSGAPANLRVLVNRRYQMSSSAALASTLAHEATHVHQVLARPPSGQAWTCSQDEELEAYLNGLRVWQKLGGEVVLSERFLAGSLEDSLTASFSKFFDENGKLSEVLARRAVAESYRECQP